MRMSSSRWPCNACIVVSMLLHAALLCIPLQGGGAQGPAGPISMTILAGTGSPGEKAADKAVAAALPTPEPTPASKPEPKPVVQKKPVPQPKPKETVRVKETIKPKPIVQSAAVTEQASLSPSASAASGSDGASQGTGGGTTGSAALSVAGGGGSGAEGPVHTSFGAVGGPGVLDWARPAYPRQAKDLHLSGRVLLRITLDEHGRPVRVEVMESAGHGFDEAAVNAVHKSRFSPASKNGKPVACVALLPVRFQLKER